MKCALFAFVIFIAGNVSAQSVERTAEWITFTPANKSFSIKMPTEPKVESEDLGGDAGDIKATYYTAEGEDVFIVLAVMYDLPMKADRLNEQEAGNIFESFRKGFAEGFQNSFAESGLTVDVKFGEKVKTTAAGLSGIDQDVSIGMFSARTRILFAKDEVFMFFVFPLPGADEGTAEKLLNTFTFNGKQAAR